MPGIQTSISMADNVSLSLHNITSALNLTLAAFRDVQGATSQDIATSAFDGAFEHINSATIAAQQFKSEIDSIKPKTVPVEVVPVWNIQSNLEVFEGSGLERLTLEMNSLSDIANEVLRSQQRIGEQALNMSLLPPNASWDINATNQRIEELGQRLLQLQNIDVSLMDESSVSRINTEVESLRQGMNNIINLQENMNSAIEQGDFSSLNAGFNQLNNVAEQFERRIRSSEVTLQELNSIRWNTPQSVELFNNSGFERFQSEITSAVSQMTSLANSQADLSLQASNMQILPIDAVNNIDNMNERIIALKDKLQELASIQLNDVGAERASAEIERLRQTLNQAVQIQEDFSNAMGSFDISSANNAFNQLDNLINNTERNFRDRLTQIRDMDLQNAKWATPQTIDVIVGSGFERYEQEVQSANDMLSRLTVSQQQIGQQAASMRILPPSAVNDLTSMSARIQALQAQITRVQNARIQVVGVERANSEVEGLRQQLNQALQVQENLNSALNNMDVSAANAAYNQLNAIVDSTERNIRDNISEQQNFNAEIRNGQNATSGLQSSIMRMAAAYLSVQGAGKVLNLSDTVTQNAARLDLIVDDGGSVEDLQNKIFLSAQRARGDYLAVSQTVSKLGLLAGDAFSSNDEMIAFTEQMNKNFVIGGASIQEQTSAMYQLTQAMASGRLQGDEYRSIIENAPLLAGAIEDYMISSGVKGTMKDWASDGLLTADVIKNALFSVADETNERFEKMPKTFADAATSIKNNAVMAFQPILDRLNEIANSEQFQTFVNNITNGLVLISNVTMIAIDFVISVLNTLEPYFESVLNWVQSIYDYINTNWTKIAPILSVIAGVLAAVVGVILLYNLVMGIASTAQAIFNAALWACPLTWIIVAVIAVVGAVYALIAGINNATGSSISATGLIFGAFAWLGSVVANIFMGLLDLILGVINALVNPFIGIANFIGNIFVDPISAIVYAFQGMADNILATLQKIASAMDFVFGSHMADTVSGWRSGLKDMADSVVEKRGFNPDDFNAINELDLSVEETLGWKRFDNTDAFMSGYNTGENIENSISNFEFDSLFKNLFENNIPSQDNYTNTYDPSSMARDVANINSNTSDMKATNEEDLKYLRDIAERETINRFTTAEVKFDMGGVHNNVNSTMDLDGIADYIGDAMMERLEVVAEGAYA